MWIIKLLNYESIINDKNIIVISISNIIQLLNHHKWFRGAVLECGLECA